MGRWVTMAGAAEYAQASKPTVRKWLHDGLVHSRITHNVVRIHTDDIDAYLRRFAADRVLVDEAIKKVMAKARSMARSAKR